MVSFYNHFSDRLGHFYNEDEKYAQPQVVDIEKEMEKFSFLKHHPDEQSIIEALFQKSIVSSNGQDVSLEAWLEASEYNPDEMKLFLKLGFGQLNPTPESGITLMHDHFPGWLIKKNYSQANEDGELKTIYKTVKASDFPNWMLPSSLKGKKGLIKIQVPNGIINVLRVWMLKRGRKWSKQLGLENARAVKEYLYPLPHANPSNPLYNRVVVISKKEDLLDEDQSFNHFVDLASKNPAKLRKVVKEMVLFGVYARITDFGLHNARFSDDLSDTVIFMDGEPVGALADASEPEMVKAIQSFDKGFFPLLGLKKLQSSVEEELEEANVAPALAERIQHIFDEEIEKQINQVIWERRWHWIKFHAHLFFPVTTFVLATLSALIKILFAWMTHLIHSSERPALISR